MSNSVNLQSLDEDGGTVVIRGGIKVAFNARGGIDVYGSVPVTLYAPLNDTARPQAKAAPQIGDRMEDGTIYAGISPDTGKPMYTTPADAPLTMKWREATDYAAGLEVHGHKNWRLPSKAELNQLFNNRVAIGGFEGGWYWSSTEINNYAAWGQQFSGGSQYCVNKSNDYFLVRCVRR